MTRSGTPAAQADPGGGNQRVRGEGLRQHDGEEILRRQIEALQEWGRADPDWAAADAACWVQTVIDGLFLRSGDEDFDAVREVSRLRLVLSRMLGLGR